MHKSFIHDVEFGNDLFDMTPKAQVTKKKYTNKTYESSGQDGGVDGIIFYVQYLIKI